MPIFGNLLVGGMPNIRMTPELPKTLLEYPRLPVERAVSGDRDSGTGEKKPDVLWGDQISLGLEKNEIISIGNSLRSAISGLVSKPGWDINTITKGSVWQDQILPIAKQLQERKVLYDANASMAEAKATHFYAAKEEARTKGLMDKSFTETLSNGLEYRIGEASDKNMYYEREGKYYLAIPGQPLEKVSKPEGFKARTYMDQFNRIERTGYGLLGRPAEAIYGEVYDIGTLQKELLGIFQSTLTELEGGKFWEMVTQIPGPQETSMDVFIKITDPRINKEVVDKVTAFAYGRLSASAKTEMLQDYNTALDRGETSASYDDWKDLKIWETAQGYKRTVAGGYDYTQITGGGDGDGGGLSAPSWVRAFMSGDFEGQFFYQTLPGLSDKEKTMIDKKIQEYGELIEADMAATGGQNENFFTNKGLKEIDSLFRSTSYYKENSKMLLEKGYVMRDGMLNEEKLNEDYVIIGKHYVQRDAIIPEGYSKITSEFQFPGSSIKVSLGEGKDIASLEQEGKAFPIQLVSGLMRPPTTPDRFGLLTEKVPSNTMVEGLQGLLDGTKVQSKEWFNTLGGYLFQVDDQPAYFIQGEEFTRGFKDENGKYATGVDGYLLVNNEINKKLIELDPVIKSGSDVGLFGPHSTEWELRNREINKLIAAHKKTFPEGTEIPMGWYKDFYLIPVIRQLKTYQGMDLLARKPITGPGYVRSRGLIKKPGGTTKYQIGTGK